MARYLLVAHQTAEAPEFVEAARQLGSEDRDAVFTLLVPATPVDHLLAWEEGETFEVARKRGQRARARFEGQGLKVEQVVVGDKDPILAMTDHLFEAGGYAAIVISTLPPGVSRWLGLDVLARARRKFPRHRIVHVISPVEEPSRPGSGPEPKQT